ncbi:hypothetical protein GTA08_BOTSDO10868 [Neofusicoccum parvum]|uniref:Uncharacterized protein n=1 Tax=Neofusicoccum parvum TaxID=310453 RepID=A0ACB5SAM3_9PEZI|nr:hypothetical protein GTA08_BOTSDO10868 [Neofusicoccum parvum]
MSRSKEHHKLEHGYPEMASLMGPFRGMALFKRFSALNARSLLYQQAELLELEADLEAYTEADRISGLPFHQNATALIGARNKEFDGRQWRLVLEIREKLKEYNAALIQQAQVGKLGDVNLHDLGVLKEWFARKHGGNNFLTGIEDKPWRDQEVADLVALSGRPYAWFTRWVIEKAVPWLYTIGIPRRKAPIQGQEEAGLVEWKDESYGKAARVTAVIMSTLIPSIAVITLYCIRSLLACIFVAMAFSMIFSIALALSNARTAEMFAATAALSSVQVVFIGSTSIG